MLLNIGVTLAKKKRTKKSKKPASKHKPKKKAPEKETPKPEKLVVTPETKRIWLKVRHAWNWSYDAFSNTVSYLKQDEAEKLYDVVRLSLFKDSYAQMLQEHPELREIVKSDDDRLCMHDVYQILAWRLGKREKFPEDKRIYMKIKGRIGRDVPVYK